MKHIISEHGGLLMQLWRRDIHARYRGSMLGIFWAVLTPLFMLAIYTFVFGMVFKAKWGTAPGGDSPVDFAIILYSGLMLHGLLSETLGRATSIIIQHQNYVKKVVFPLEILPVLVVLSSLFMFAIQFILLIIAMLFLGQAIPLTIIFTPLVLAPFLILCFGVSWFMASIGVYIRDVSHFIGLVITLLLFLSPIFYPINAIPESFQIWIYLNPLTIIIEQLRAVVIYGEAPNWMVLGLYSAASSIVAIMGYIFFVKTRKGFNDIV